MKSLKLVFTILAFSLVTLSMYSCGNGKNAKANTEQSKETSKQGKEFTSNYICPMHCDGSGSEKPGKCPVCGMDYKKNDKNNKEDHSGHNH